MFEEGIMAIGDKYSHTKRQMQIHQTKNAAALYIKGLSYKVPHGISKERFRGMILAYLNGNHNFNWED